MPGLELSGRKRSSVPRDHRAAKTIVHAGGDDVGISADPVGRKGSADRRGEVGALDIHKDMVVFDAEGCILPSPISFRRAAIDMILPEIHQICCISRITLKLKSVRQYRFYTAWGRFRSSGNGPGWRDRVEHADPALPASVVPGPRGRPPSVLAHGTNSSPGLATPPVCGTTSDLLIPLK
jgi:hypothetical protein